MLHSFPSPSPHFFFTVIPLRSISIALQLGQPYHIDDWEVVAILELIFLQPETKTVACHNLNYKTTLASVENHKVVSSLMHCISSQQMMLQWLTLYGPHSLILSITHSFIGQLTWSCLVVKIGRFLKQYCIKLYKSTSTVSLAEIMFLLVFVSLWTE